MNQSSDESPWSVFYEKEGKFYDYEYSRVTVIIPTHNCAELVGITLDSIFKQNYPDYEIVIVDAESSDRTMDVIKSCPLEKIRIYTVAQYHVVEMLNKGSSLATGLYLNFLFPGDFYLIEDAMKIVMTKALEEDYPDLVYGGALLREGLNPPRTFLRPLTTENLKKGRQPTTGQSCWIYTETFKKIGKFDTSYKLRGSLDFICRLHLDKNVRIASVPYILTDNDRREITSSLLTAHFFETMRIIFCYFGLTALFRWFFHQKHVSKIIKGFFRTIRRAFLGP